MPDKHDKLQLLKSKYLEEVRATEAKLQSLRGKLQLIQELEVESESLEVGPAGNGRYKDIGLTDAVLDAVKALAVGTCISAGDVRRYLFSQGYQPKGKNFDVTLGTTLKRLAKSNRIQTKVENGRRLYAAN